MAVLEALQELLDNGVPVASIKDLVDEMLENDGLEDSDDLKPLVLFSHLNGEDTDIEAMVYDDCMLSVGGSRGSVYLVCTEDEREVKWEECLESYLDDGCVEGADGPYFDREAWKRDARMDGAAHALSCYDGQEYEYKYAGEWFYIYRQN